MILRAPNKMTLHSNGLFRLWTASGCIDNAVHCLLRLPCQKRKRSFSVLRFILIGTLNQHFTICWVGDEQKICYNSSRYSEYPEKPISVNIVYPKSDNYVNGRVRQLGRSTYWEC